MNSFDNMGGFVSASFILHQEVTLFIRFKNHCLVKLKKNADWRQLSTKHMGINLTVTPENTDAGNTYDIKGTLILKKESLYLDILRNNPSIILKCQLPDGRYRVFGTDEYPLKSMLRPLTPDKPSGFSGYELSFEGKQLIEPPILSI